LSSTALAKDDYDENGPLCLPENRPEIVSGAEGWDEDAWRGGTDGFADEEKELQIKVFSADGTQLAEPAEPRMRKGRTRPTDAAEKRRWAVDEDDEERAAGQVTGQDRQAKIAADDW